MLTLLELAVPTFVLVWFGLDAIVVGLLVALFPVLTVGPALGIGRTVVLILPWLRLFKSGNGNATGSW